MISILITHYKRPKALQACIHALRAVTWNTPVEIVVADDGSERETQHFLKTLSVDTLLLSEKNRGLASNLNKGIKACRGNYILYVQEDFVVDPTFDEIVDESLKLLSEGSLDMIRYCANYRFRYLLPVTKNSNEIPKFSFRNFNINTFQYSDNPFITTPEFFERFGYFLENTSGGYGETEYAIRVLKSRAKIGITNKYYFKHSQGIPSVMDVDPEAVQRKGRTGIKKKLWRFARAVRQHVEWVLYNPQKRKLYTYSNKRSTR